MMNTGASIILPFPFIFAPLFPALMPIKEDCKHLRQGDFYYKGNEISGGSSIHRHDSDTNSHR